MGYSTRAEYTIELIRDPKSYSHIGRQYFATGFILASSIDEWTLEAILQKWQEIDSVTSDRIRFLFFIDNETTLTGYPNMPIFTENGYKRHHSRLLEIARKQGFNLSVKTGTQVHNDPFGRTKYSWHPQDRVRKLAQQLGIAQLMPCLVWVRYDEPDYIYTFPLEKIVPDGIYAIIREFCDKFYDDNVSTLSKIGEIESNIEQHCGVLDASLKELGNVPSLLSQKRKLDKILQSTQNIIITDKTWLAQINEIVDLTETISSLAPISKFQVLFSFIKSITKWARACKAAHETLSGENRNRIPVPHLANAIARCLVIDIPGDAARLIPQPDPDYTSDIFLELLNLVPPELISNDGPRQTEENERRSLKAKLDRLRNYVTKRIELQNEQIPLTTSNEDIVTLVNISTILHELIETVPVPETLHTFSSKIDSILSRIFYNSTLALAITLRLWMYYQTNDINKYIEEQIRSIVGSIEYTKRLYDESQLWYEQVQKPLTSIDTIEKILKWSTLSSYKKHRLASLSNDLLVTRNNIASEDNVDAIRKEINNTLIPIATAIAEFGIYDLDTPVSNYMNQIRSTYPLLQIPEEFKIELEDNKMEELTVLFLSADPTNTSRLRLGEEFREIQEKLRLAKQRGRFRLEIPQLSIRPADISQALLDTHPKIVHFSGHGTSDGALCFENQTGQAHLVQPDALAALFEQFVKQVNCVLLNACYSEIQAKAIAKYIEYVIGMNQAIGDKAAIAFAIGFYQALGAGRTIEDAYKLGCVQIRLQGIPEHLTPVLIKNGQPQQQTTA